MHSNPNRPTVRTLRLYPAITRLAVCSSPISRYHSPDLRSDKSQVKPLRQQIPCRLIVVPVPALCSPHVCHAAQIERIPGAKSCGRCARCMQTGCNKGDEQTDLIAPGNLRIWGSGDAHANDPNRTCSTDEDPPDEMAVDLRRAIEPCFCISMKVKADCFKLVCRRPDAYTKVGR